MIEHGKLNLIAIVINAVEIFLDLCKIYDPILMTGVMSLTKTTGMFMMKR